MTATAMREVVGTSAATTRLQMAREPLRAALGKLAGVTDTSKQALPVAQYVLLEARDGTLSLTATNFQTWVRLVVPCVVDGGGSVLLPAKRLTEIIGSLPPSPVSLVFNDTQATITAGRSRFDVQGLAVSEFPGLPAVDPQQVVTVDAAIFLDALSRAVGHASDAASRPAINTVLITAHQGALTLVGCSGITLARLPAGPGTITADILVARIDVPSLCRIFAGLKDEATLTLTADTLRLCVSSDTTTAHVRLVDQKFPAYEQLIRQTPKHTVVCDRAALLNAFKRVGLASDVSGRVHVTLDGDITLRADTAETGTASDVVLIDSHDRTGNQPLTFDISASVATRALDTLTADRVQFTLETRDKAVMFRNAEPKDSALLLAMPLRIL